MVLQGASSGRGVVAGLEWTDAVVIMRIQLQKKMKKRHVLFKYLVCFLRLLGQGCFFCQEN
jgi:hypothetical protein